MKDRRSPLLEGMRYAQSGTMLIVPMIVLGGLGYWLDRRLGWEPWLLLAGLVLGMASGFLNFFRLVLPPQREKGGGTDGDPPGGGRRGGSER